MLFLTNEHGVFVRFYGAHSAIFQHTDTAETDQTTVFIGGQSQRDSSKKSGESGIVLCIHNLKVSDISPDHMNNYLGFLIYMYSLNPH